MNAAPKLISLVIPCYNESEAFPHLRASLATLVTQLEPRYKVEIVLVDDGSRDDTWEKIVAFSAEDPRVKAVALSRNFGHQAALTCGYDLTSGDAAISLDADLQDPTEVVHDLIAAWEQGADVVYAVRSSREGETAMKLLTARIFYRLITLLSDRQSVAPENSGDFRLMSRKSLEALRQLREAHRYLRGMVGWIGFKTVIVKYQRKARVAGVTKYNFTRMLRLAIDAIVSSSTVPLRFTYFFALIGSFVVLSYLGYTAIRHVFFGSPLVHGWSSTILAITVFGCFTLFSLGIIGEYVGRIYEQSKNRPLYLVRDVLNAAAKTAPAEPAPSERARVSS